MIRDPCDRLRQQSCQRGLTFVANAARAARHQSCDSQKADVQREPTTQDCYWHEYSLKLCDNDGRVLYAFLHLRIKSSRCAGESDDLERKRVAIWSAKSEPSPAQGRQGSGRCLTLARHPPKRRQTCSCRPLRLHLVEDLLYSMRGQTSRSWEREAPHSSEQPAQAPARSLEGRTAGYS